MVRSVVVDELVSAVGDSVVPVHGVGSGEFVVVVVEALAPVCRGLAFEQGDEGGALDVLGDRDASHIQEGGGEVEIGGDVCSVDGAGFDGAGPADEEGCFEGLLVHPAFVEPAVFAEIPTLIGGVDDDGVVGESGFIEIIEDFTDAVVDGLHAAEVVFDVALVFPLHEFLAFELCRLERFILGAIGGVPGFELFGGEASGLVQLEIVGAEVLGDGHGLVSGGGFPAFVVVPEGFGFRDRFVVEPVEVFRSGLPVAMGGLVLVHQHEGLLGVATVFKPGEGLVGDDVGGVADVFVSDDLPGVVVRLHGRVVVGALADEDVEVVVALGGGLQVPFSNDRGLVA